MPEIKKSSVSLDFGFLKLQAEISEEDRQCAWELYTEIVTRVSLIGKHDDPDCRDFSGELFVESFDSIHKFFCEVRSIMRKYPVGRIAVANKNHLGIAINELIVCVLRPFLEKWQAEYRYWWSQHSFELAKQSPTKLQQLYPKYKEMTKDWCNLRLSMRALLNQLVDVYQLVDVHSSRIKLNEANNVKK
jgi:hypothetical protein